MTVGAILDRTRDLYCRIFSEKLETLARDFPLRDPPNEPGLGSHFVTWAFPIPPAAAVVTTTYVTRDRSPILLVSREQADDGDDQWQFHCGNGDYEPSKLQLVRLEELVSLDPTLKGVADLAVGHVAEMARRERAEGRIERIAFLEGMPEALGLSEERSIGRS